MGNMKEVEFEVMIRGKGWLLVPEGEDPEKYVQNCTAQYGGNKLWGTKIVVKNVKVKESKA